MKLGAMWYIFNSSRRIYEGMSVFFSMERSVDVNHKKNNSHQKDKKE